MREGRILNKADKTDKKGMQCPEIENEMPSVLSTHLQSDGSTEGYFFKDGKPKHISVCIP